MGPLTFEEITVLLGMTEALGERFMAIKAVAD